MTTRVGIGFDAHPFIEGRELALGGVVIPFERGLDGHSDADVLTHAVIDACLGAANLGDIGAHFPSSDPATRGARSVKLLSSTVGELRRRGWKPEYVDATIVAERPKLRPYIGYMRASLSEALEIGVESVSVKATTTDHLGFVGREEGICCVAVATISKI